MSAELSSTDLFIGLMSGTSLDGADAVLARFDSVDGRRTISHVVATSHSAFPSTLRDALFALQDSGADEIHREAVAAQQLMHCYAACVAQLLQAGATSATQIRAIGAHGQTIRHRPELGYTRQMHNGALLAELSGIDTIVDFRSRDVAAGGQGAPLVPAFHQHLFGVAGQPRVIANIGGISNISVLGDAVTTGFDTGPGNVLMDFWIKQQRGLAYDADGAWADSGHVSDLLLAALRNEKFFKLNPPKSTGRDLFNQVWLETKLTAFGNLPPADVQATLTEFTATTLADAIHMAAPSATAVYICGGGAFNGGLLRRLQAALDSTSTIARVATTAELGVPPDQVEALAFAWLARQFTERLPGNLPAVTGASGPRVLGALYPSGTAS